MKPETKAKISASNRMAYLGEGSRRKLSESLKAKWASGTRKPHPDWARKKAGETLRKRYASGEIVARKLDAETRAKVGRKLSEKYKGRVLRKTRNSAAEIQAFRHRRMTDPRTAPGEDNIKSGIWRLRSPVNKVYQFKNLRKFVDENPNLFDPEDVVWREKYVNGQFCRRMCHAYGGLAILSPRKKHAFGSWKGWTWHSQTERLKNEGRDLLERRVK